MFYKYFHLQQFFQDYTYLQLQIHRTAAIHMKVKDGWKGVIDYKKYLNALKKQFC